MSEIFRDRTEGTQAKRQELLRRRREELVMMPHAVRRVIVARSSRIAASVAGALMGVGLIAMAYSPSLASRMASYMPGIQPAPLSTLLSGAWLLGLVAWAISRARVEHRFAVEMSKYVLPTQDLDHDVERLDHERPDEIARHMGHRLEVRSAAWPVFAAAVVLPATALWVARAIRTRGWPVMSEFEASLALHAGMLAAIGVIGAVVAIVMTRKASRTYAVGVMAAMVGGLASCMTIGAFVAHKSYAWPLLGVTVLTVMIGWLGRALQIERDRLEVDDPAAGAEIFTIRGFLRQMREAASVVRGALAKLNRKQVVMLGAGTCLLVGGGLVYRAKHHAVAKQSQQLAQAQVLPYNIKPDQLMPLALPTPEDHLPYEVKRVGQQFLVEATLDDKGELNVPMIGFSTVPKSWGATLKITLGAGSESVAIVNPDHSTTLLSQVTTVGNGAASVMATEIAVNACNEPQPLSVKLQGTPGRTVSVLVAPVLRVADCK